MKAVTPIRTTVNSKSVWFAYFNPLCLMELPFEEIQQTAKKVFAIQKKILRLLKIGVKKSLL